LGAWLWEVQQGTSKAQIGLRRFELVNIDLYSQNAIRISIAPLVISWRMQKDGKP
jgi:hypothetical protein